MYIEVNGVRLNTVSFGSGNRTILAHGGFVVGWEMWIQGFEELSKRWRCVSYDHRGTGESPASPDTITDETIIEDIFGVLDHLKVEKCILMGESMGGRVAILAALRHPERFEGLVLMGSLSHLPARLSDESLSQQIKMLKTNYKGFMENFVKTCFPEPNIDHIHRWGINVCLRNELEATIRYLSMFHSKSEENIQLPLSDIKIPTLVIQGEKDAFAPLEHAKILADTIPDAELVIIKGAGHVPIVTKPQEVISAIENRFAT